MRSTLSGWEVDLTRWLKPFLDRLGHKAGRRMCPSGLHLATMISCTILSLLASGTRRR